MGDVVVIGPEPEHAAEILGKARELAKELGGKVVACAFGDHAAGAGQLGPKGADRILTNSNDALKGPFQVEPWAAAIEQVATKLKPSAILIGSSVRTKDAAARAATRLEVGVGSDYHSITLQDGRIVGERTYFSGNSMLSEKLTKDPQIVLVPSRVFEPKDEAGEGATEEFALEIAAPKTKLSGQEKKAEEGVNLEEADIVVSVGRGVKKKEDLKLVEDLAKAMGGSVGCTRPIAADLKWLGDEHWIGLSGHEVKPKAYIGIGVSGQIQHVAGMRGSKLIVSINKDEEAPLVKISDYAIIEDLYKVVPAFIEAVKKVRGG